MKILFLHFKAVRLKTVRLTVAILLIAVGVLIVLNPLYALLPLGITLILLFLPVQLSENKCSAELVELNNVLKNVKAGFLGSRMPRSNPNPVQEEIRIAINAALDQTETTFIEMLGAMEAGNTGRPWRRLQTQGLNGAFKIVLEKMQVLLDNLEASTVDAAQTHAEVEAIHKHTRDSIEYAAIMQRTILPNLDDFYAPFTDSFALWKPKDIVGGDIWFFERLKDEGEYLLFVIDCTGHGVQKHHCF
jgi:hypothetical protein